MIIAEQGPVPFHCVRHQMPCLGHVTPDPVGVAEVGRCSERASVITTERQAVSLEHILGYFEGLSICSCGTQGGRKVHSLLENPGMALRVLVLADLVLKPIVSLPGGFTCLVVMSFFSHYTG